MHTRFRRATSLLLVPALLATLLTGLLAGSAREARAWDNETASTPPLGWNSYDAFNWSVTEADVRANADYMRDNLRQHGGVASQRRSP
jgi:hypothetical protein